MAWQERGEEVFLRGVDSAMHAMIQGLQTFQLVLWPGLVQSVYMFDIFV